MKLMFVCREGFAFVGYQRVQVVLVGDDSESNTDSVMKILEASERLAAVIHKECDNCAEDLDSISYRVNSCLFVPGSESLTLHDWVDSTWDGCSEVLLKHLQLDSIEVFFKDGDEEEQKLC